LNNGPTLTNYSNETFHKQRPYAAAAVVPPPSPSEGSGQTDKNMDVCQTIHGADSVQLTVLQFAMIIQYMPTHFMQGLNP